MSIEASPLGGVVESAADAAASAAGRSVPDAIVATVIAEWTREHRSRSHSSLHGRVVSWRGHREILDAVLARDSTRAAEAMGRHLREVRDVVALLDLELLEP